MNNKQTSFRVIIALCFVTLIGAGCSKSTSSPVTQTPAKPPIACNPPSDAFPVVEATLTKDATVIQAQKHLKEFASTIRVTHDVSKLTSFLAPSSSIAGIGQDIWPQAVTSFPSRAVSTYLDNLACELEFAVPVQLDSTQKMILFATQMPLSSGSYSPAQRWFSYDEKNYGFLSPR